MSDSNSEIFKELLLAKWSERFVAWLIDFIIISSIFFIIFASFSGTWGMEWDAAAEVHDEISFLPSSIVFFSYWIILEYKKGYSIGKKIFHLKVLNIDGKHPTLLGTILSSFGKSFLLPIDFILGLIFTNQKRQRIFNKLGNTIVIKIKESENQSENIRYVKD